jgi:hypothetical protein
MDTTGIVIIGLLILMILGAFFVYQRRAKVSVEGFGAKATIDASNEAKPVINTGSIKSRQGGLDAAGHMKLGDIEVEKDIKLREEDKTSPNP